MSGEMSSAGTLYDVLEWRARQHPESVMLAVEGVGGLTYEDWRARAARLAVVLRQAGVGPGDVVSLNFTAKEWLDYAVAYLAAQRLGACIETVREDISISSGVEGASFALTGDAVSAGGLRFGDLMRRGVVDGSAPPDWRVDPHAPAEILRSSGSTGVPKRIVRSFADLVGWESDPIPVTDDPSEMVLYSPFGTNASQKQIISVLRSGTTRLVMLPVFTPQLLLSTVRRRKAWGVSLVPSAAEMVLRAGGELRADLASVRCIVLSSDFATPELQNRLLEVMPRASITKRYGLTEAGVASVVGEFDPARPLRIGLPTAGTELAIVDEQQHRVPEGVEGFITIRSVPQQAAECDVPWVFTRDRGRLLADGSLEVFGRDTDFLHVGTTRVSARFVESTLLGWDDVADVAVVRVGDDDENGRIGVLIVPTAEGTNVLDEARIWLRSAYGLTNSRLLLSTCGSVPRTTTGKPATVRIVNVLTTGSAYAPADDDVEGAILEIARRQLEDVTLAIDDVLVQRGLSSLGSVALMAAVEERFGLTGRLDLSAPFFHSTVADLAKYVDDVRDSGPHDGPVDDEPLM